MIAINIKQQTLKLYRHNQLIKSYSISTAKNGSGYQEGSFCTPLGEHRIAQKIGAAMPSGTVFTARVPTGETYSEDLARANDDRDWILSRILWLEGCEKDNQNSRQRFIYIHGSPDSTTMGKPGSKGCIRMHNKAIITLFDLVSVNETVLIKDN